MHIDFQSAILAGQERIVLHGKEQQGTGYIRKREDNGNVRWEGQYYYDGHRKSIYGPDYETVRMQLNEILASIYRKTNVDGSTTPVASYLYYWLEDVCQVRPLTKLSDSGYIEGHIMHSRLGSLPMKRASLIDFQEFFNQKAINGRLDGKPGGLSPKSLHNMKVMMRQAFDYAVYPLKLIPYNPMQAVHTPKVILPEIKILGEDEQERLEEACFAYPDPNAGFIILDLYAGPRIGELVGFKWDDFGRDFEWVKIRRSLSRIAKELITDGSGYELVDKPYLDNAKSALYAGPPKTVKGRRMAYLPDIAREATKRVWDYQQEHGISNSQGYAVLNSQGYPIESRTYMDLFGKVLKYAGLNHINFHALRHTFATRALQLDDVDLKTVSEALGHAKASTTLNMYVHSEDKKKQEMARKFNRMAGRKGRDFTG